MAHSVASCPNYLNVNSSSQYSVNGAIVYTFDSRYNMVAQRFMVHASTTKHTNSFDRFNYWISTLTESLSSSLGTRSVRIPSDNLPTTLEAFTGRGSQTVRLKCALPANSRSTESCVNGSETSFETTEDTKKKRTCQKLQQTQRSSSHLCSPPQYCLRHRRCFQ